MKLEEYVRQTLLDITNGVASAQQTSKLWIAPGSIEGKKVLSPQLVNFEIALTVNKEAGAGIEVWSLVDMKAAGTSEQINKISFAVPV
jgi:hypothetical protein